MDIIHRIDAYLAEYERCSCQGLEPDPEPVVRSCRDEIIAARACAEMMLQGTGQPLAERMAKRVLDDITNTFAGVPCWIPVSERLPEDGKPVLCSDDFDGWREVLQHEGLSGWVDIRGNQAYAKPTHWMPLPDPPAS